MNVCTKFELSSLESFHLLTVFDFTVVFSDSFSFIGTLLFFFHFIGIFFFVLLDEQILGAFFLAHVLEFNGFKFSLDDLDTSFEGP